MVEVLPWKGHKAALTYTFDDSNSSQLEHYEVLSALGVPFSFYLWTEKVESKSPVWTRALREGHELGNHSHTHQQDGPTIGQDTDRATSFIEENFDTKVWTMAAPYGSTAYGAVAQTRFLINRGVKDGIILPLDDTDRFDLNCFIPKEGAPESDYNRKVDAALAAGGWQVMLVHGFLGGTDKAYQPVGLEEFVRSVEYAKSKSDVWIGTLLDVGAYWLGHQAFAAARTTKEGQSVVYDWTLPTHFPPGHSLLVRSQGKLTQEGKALPKRGDDVYEVSLDTPRLAVVFD